jgi:hypothetical protein
MQISSLLEPDMAYIATELREIIKTIANYRQLGNSTEECTTARRSTRHGKGRCEILVASFLLLKCVD